MSDKKGHLDTDRLDCVTILPPPTVPCNITLLPNSAVPAFTHFVTKDGLPSMDCPHLDCVVDAVHKL